MASEETIIIDGGGIDNINWGKKIILIDKREIVEDITPDLRLQTEVEKHKTRNFIAKFFIVSYFILIAIYVFLNLVGVCPKDTFFSSILEKLTLIIGTILGFYFGERYGG